MPKALASKLDHQNYWSTDIKVYNEFIGNNTSFAFLNNQWRVYLMIYSLLITSDKIGHGGIRKVRQ